MRNKKKYSVKLDKEIPNGNNKGKFKKKYSILYFKINDSDSKLLFK